MHHENCSVRDFLIHAKSYSENQYKFVMRNAPVIEWQEYRNTVKNDADAAMIKQHIDEHVLVQSTFVRAARLGMEKAVESIAQLQVRQERKYRDCTQEIANAMKAIQTAQNVYLKAMGIGSHDGLSQLYASVKAVTPPCSDIAPKTELEKTVERLTYDEVFEMIEIKRAMMRDQHESQKETESCR